MSAVEEWRPVVGFEGAYEVSDQGRVRSLDRMISARSKLGKTFLRLKPGQLIQPGPHLGGYASVHLYQGGRQRSTVLHIIVTEAFHGPRPTPLHEVRHLDGSKTNCRADNLKWGTHAENEADKLLHGTRLKGEQHGHARLTASDVAEIRARRGELQQDLADEFGCTFSNISAIQRRKSWRHV